MNPKAKGSSFEWEVARLLSLWWTDNERDDIFCRTQSSGARATVRGRKGKKLAHQFGDITYDDPEGEFLIRHWSIEAKTGYGTKNAKTKKITGWCVLDLLDSKQKETTLEKLWNQASIDAISSNRTPILIFRRNLKSVCIMFSKMLKSKISQYKGDPEKVIEIEYHNCETDTILTLCVMNFDDFCYWFDSPRDFFSRLYK